MFSKLAKLGVSIATLCVTGSAEELMKLLGEGENPIEATKDYQFSVVSFYSPSNEASMEIQEMIEGGIKYFNNKIRIGDWGQRQVGWFKVDIDATPELAYNPDKIVPDQAVIGPGVHRLIHFAKIHEEKDDNERVFAEVIRELTGDWLSQIKCDEI